MHLRNLVLQVLSALPSYENRPLIFPFSLSSASHLDEELEVPSTLRDRFLHWTVDGLSSKTGKLGHNHRCLVSFTTNE